MSTKKYSLARTVKELKDALNQEKDRGRRLERTLDLYAEEARHNGRPRVLTLGLHPHLMGVPHRYADLLDMLDRLQRHPMTRFVTGAGIYEWYAGQIRPDFGGAQA